MELAGIQEITRGRLQSACTLYLITRRMVTRIRGLLRTLMQINKFSDYQN